MIFVAFSHGELDWSFPSFVVECKKSPFKGVEPPTPCLFHHAASLYYATTARVSAVFAVYYTLAEHNEGKVKMARYSAAQGPPQIWNTYLWLESTSETETHNVDLISKCHYDLVSLPRQSMEHANEVNKALVFLL